MKLLIDTVATGQKVPSKQFALMRLTIIVSLAGTVALISALCRSLSGLVSEAQTTAVTDYIHNMLITKSVTVDLQYYENSHYHDTFHRAQHEAPHRPARIVNALVQISQGGISLLLMASLLLSLHWSLAALLFITVIPGVVIRIRYSNEMFRWQQQQTRAYRQADYFYWLLTGDVHAKEVRLFDLGHLFSHRFHELRKQFYLGKLQIAKKRCLREFVTQGGATIAIFSSYAFIGYRAIGGSITLGDLVMYYQAFQRGQEYLQQMLSSLTGLYEDNLFIAHLYEFLDLEQKVVEPLSPHPVPHPIKKGIVFDRVNFQYPGDSRHVLEDISFTIKPGETIALVGENGSGKTTLIKLLCRLYDPTEGAITIDDIDLRQFKISMLRREISVVFQDYARYFVTAAENIQLGNVDLAPDDHRIKIAACQTGADTFIAKLPLGYKTILGKWFENGQELSIGEWQKVAMARAFLRDSPIIVLDEPTSALDAKAENEVTKKFHQLSNGKITILISHRMSTVKMADRIYVLKHGTIIESGSHDELMQQSGTYASLFEAQAQHYI